MSNESTPLTDAMQKVAETRHANEDVFLWPGVLWDVLYCHEELSEFTRVLQTLNAPDHARNSTDNSLTPQEHLLLEWGQSMMMMFTLAIEAGITDPDLALNMALKKIETVSARKRA